MNVTYFLNNDFVCCFKQDRTPHLFVKYYLEMFKNTFSKNVCIYLYLL